MSFSPANVLVYTAAFTGALAGITATIGVPSVNTSAQSYVGTTGVADGYAQAVDMLWNTAVASQLDLDAINNISQEAWSALAPISTDSSQPATWAAMAAITIKLVQAAKNAYASEGIVPPPLPSPAGTGGGGLAIIHMADANQAPPASVTNNQTLVLEDATTNDRTLTLPDATNAAAYIRMIVNLQTGPHGAIVTVSAGTTVHIPNLSFMWVRVDATGVSPASSGINPGSGQDSLQYGLGANASGPLSIALGKLCTATAAAAVALGESINCSGTNAMALGFNITASGANAVGLGTNLSPTGDNSCALGVNTNAARAGEYAHNSGHSNVQGKKGIDLMRLATAAAVNLWDVNGLPFILDNVSFILVDVWILAVQLAPVGKVAAEKHQLVISAPLAGAPDAVIISDDPIGTAGTIAAQGWSVVISCPAGTQELRFHCDPAADTVRFMVRCDWTQIGNVQ